MKKPTLVRRSPAHTHWVKGRFLSLTSAEVLLVQAHFAVGDRAADVAKKFRCCVGTIYRAKNSVLVKHIEVDRKALDRSLTQLALVLKKKPAKIRLKVLPNIKTRLAS